MHIPIKVPEVEHVVDVLEHQQDETLEIYETKETKETKFDSKYLEMAKIWASNSYCKRMQVGALIVKDGRIISDGYNGTPSGMENNCEDEIEEGVLKTKWFTLHAEANALAKLNESAVGATIYVTISPCKECSKTIVQKGIKRVVFGDFYRDKENIQFLEDNGIEVVKLGEDITPMPNGEALPTDLSEPTEPYEPSQDFIGTVEPKVL
jgi:dCMP deaminase